MNTINTLSTTVVNATTEDQEFICALFEQAIAFIKENNYVGWTSYDKAFIKADIDKKLLFKIMEIDTIICAFSVCFSDDLIWREMETGEAIYLHRIVINPAFRGGHTFQRVLEWAIQFAEKSGLKYIRMDTWSENPKIIAYYKKYGFRFVQDYITPDTPALPIQHRKLKVALLEYVL